MRVTAVRTVLVTAPWTGDPFWQPGELFERTAALVVVETDEGLIGVGETVMGYFCADTVPPLVDYYGGLLVELGLDPRQPEACFRELYQRSLWWGRVGLGLSVLSGVEMALWDIAGKAAGRPVHELLGGPAHDRLPLYASGGTGSWPVEKTVDQARRYEIAGLPRAQDRDRLRRPPGRLHDRARDAAVRHLVRRQHRRADRRRACQVRGAARGPRAGHRARHRLPRRPGPRAVVAPDGARPGPCPRAVRPAVHRGAAPLRRPGGLRRASPGDTRPDRRRRVPDRRSRSSVAGSTPRRSTTSSPTRRTSAASASRARSPGWPRRATSD